MAGNNFIFNFYSKVISPVDGDRCPMTPSCSQYAARAIEKHGSVMGWIMACDRLQRCGRDTAALSKTVMVGNVPLSHDPVSENDFWWFEKNQDLND